MYHRVAETLEARRFYGADPFDALNSKLFKATPFASVPIARLAWLQLFKRLPIDLRSLARIPPTVNPVTLALASRTYARRGEENKCRQVLQQLLAMRCDPVNWGKGAWGYPFAWQARSFYVPLGTPNIIATAYAIRALDECAEWSGERVDPVIEGAAQFVAGSLSRRSQTGAIYLTYVPGSSAMVHNANLWGAHILALAVDRGGPEAWRRLAEQAIDYTIRAQRRDGSWRYGEAAHHSWTDSFHTGYVLEALHLCRRLLKRDDLADSIDRGVQYYLDSFLRDDGVVSYYAAGKKPLDANCFAQMVITLEAIRPRPDWEMLADRVLSAAISQLWCPDLNAFAYQRTETRLVKTVYPRWTQIWMMHALALRLDQLREQRA